MRKFISFGVLTLILCSCEFSGWNTNEGGDGNNSENNNGIVTEAEWNELTKPSKVFMNSNFRLEWDSPQYGGSSNYYVDFDNGLCIDSNGFNHNQIVAVNDTGRTITTKTYYKDLVNGHIENKITISTVNIDMFVACTGHLFVNFKYSDFTYNSSTQSYSGTFKLNINNEEYNYGVNNLRLTKEKIVSYDATTMGSTHHFELTHFGEVSVPDFPQPEPEGALPENDPSSEITINFWHCLSHAKTTQLQRAINAFNIKYAGKYKVVLTNAAGDYGDLDDVVKTKLSAGEVPALTMGYPDSFSSYITQNEKRSKILKIDDYINNEIYGFTQSEIDDFVSANWNQGNNYQFEGTWSLPLLDSTDVMYFNKTFFYGCNEINDHIFRSGSLSAEYSTLASKVDHFNRETASDEAIEQYNSDLETLKAWCEANGGKTYDVPVTWEEMIQTARNIKADRTAEGLGGQFFPIGYDSDSNLMITQLAQLGYDFTVNDEASKENPVLHYQFDNQNTRDLLNEITTYIKEGIMETKGSLGGQYTNTFFTAGKCIMSIGSTGGSSYKASQNFDVSIAPVPTRAGKTAKYIQQGPSICFFDNNNKWIHKGAWLFYREFLSDPEYNAKLALENSYDPIRKASYTLDFYTDWVSYAGHGLAYDIPAITQTLKNNYMTPPVFVGSGTAREEIGNTIAYVIGRNMSVANAVQTAYNICVQQ